MRKKPYPIGQLVGGMDVSIDAVFLTDVRSPNLNIVRTHKGLVKKDFGFNSFASLTSQRPMLIDTYYQQDGDVYTLCVGVDHAYKLDSGAWTKISADPGPSFTGDEDDIFWSTTMNDLWIVMNGKDTPFKWNGSTWGTLGGLTNIVPNFCQPFFNHLVLASTTESGTKRPFRVKWSVADDPEDYSGTGSGFFDLSDTVDWITGLSMLGDRLFVFKERSIWEIIHIGGTDVFDARLVVDGVGTYCGHSIVSLGDELLFFGSDGLYFFDGSHIRSAGAALFPLLFETGEKIVDASKLNRSQAVYMEETGEYVIALPTSSGEPDLILKYDVTNESWTKRNDITVTAFGYYTAVASVTWASATGTWVGGNWDIPWRRQQLPPGAPTTLYAQPSGTIVEEDRTAECNELMVWESKDFLFGHASRIVEMRYVAKGDAFDVSYSLDQGKSWSAEKTLTPDTQDFTECVHYLNVTTRTIRARVRTYNPHFELKWVEPWYIERARSKTLQRS